MHKKTTGLLYDNIGSGKDHHSEVGEYLQSGLLGHEPGHDCW